MGRIKDETISGVKWGLIQRLTMQPVQFVFGVILARLISPSEMGILGLTAIFFSVASILKDAGFGSALVRKQDRTETDCSTVFWFNVIVSALVESYTFRDKRWSWYRFNMKATFSGGKSYYGFWERDPFYRGFLADLFLRDCCYRCPFSNHTRYSDITLSDFWGYWAVKDGFKDDDAGISMCMCNTVRGVELLAAARHRLVIHPTEREASLANGGFNPREETIEGKYDFLSAYKKNGFPVLLGDYYRPAELPPERKLLYIFGKGTVMLRISNRLLNLYRKARRRFYHLMRGKKK